MSNSSRNPLIVYVYSYLFTEADCRILTDNRRDRLPEVNKIYANKKLCNRQLNSRNGEENPAACGEKKELRFAS